MPTEPVTLSLPTDLLAAIRDAVEAGEYASLDEAVGDAVRAWSCRHEDREEGLAVIRARIRASLDDPRPALSRDEVDAHLEAFFARAKARGNEAA